MYIWLLNCGYILISPPGRLLLGRTFQSKLDSFAKVRGAKAAKKAMFEAIENDLAEYAWEDMSIYAVTTCDEEETEAWRQEVQNRFPEYDVKAEYLSLSVTCHIGPGALAVAYAKNVK